MFSCVCLFVCSARSCERIHPDGSAFVWLDRAKGLGTLFNADGSERRGGAWNRDTNKQEGPGFMLLPNGDRYTGCFANDKRHGAGSITNAHGDTVFVGQFTNGDRATGVSRTKVSGGGEDVFDGSWLRNCPYQGTYTFADGCVKQGTFRSGGGGGGLASAPAACLEGVGLMVAPRVAPAPNAAPVSSTREATSARNSCNNGAANAAVAASSSSPSASASSSTAAPTAASSSSAAGSSKTPSDFWINRRFAGASSCDEVGDDDSIGGVLYEGEFGGGGGGLRSGWGVEWDAAGRVTRCGTWEHGQLAESKPVPISRLFNCIKGATHDLAIEQLEALAASSSSPAKPQYCFLSTLARGSTLLYPCGAFDRGGLDVAGLPSGLGAKYNADSSLRERGFYVSGLLRGPHGQCFTKATRDHFQGDFFAGKPHGHGQMKYSNGDRYVGAWARGFRFGKGTMYYAAATTATTAATAADPSLAVVTSSSSSLPSQGDVYEGLWRDDRSGVGALTRGGDGSVHEGEWAAGRGNGLGMEWDAQGRLTSCGIWSHDTFLHSSPVPRHVITQARFLNQQGQCAHIQRKRNSPLNAMRGMRR